MDKEKFNILAFSDEEINDELIDVLIKAGSHEYIENSTMEVPDSELSDIEFSKELDKKMLQYFDTLDKQEKNKKIKLLMRKTKNVALRAAAVFLVMVILAFGFVVTSEAAQISIINMFIEHSDIDSSVLFDENEENTQQQIPNKQQLNSLEYIFWYIPDGYELVSENQAEDINMLVYEGLDGGYLEITQSLGGNLRLDSEDTEYYNLEINNIVCFVSIDEKKVIVVFDIDNNHYMLTSTLPIEEIIKIIENINY